MKLKSALLLAALIAVGTLSTDAAAYDPFIDWGPLESFAYEPGFVLPHQSVAGNVLTIVGKVDNGFFGPLAGNILGPGVEYTFVIDGLVSQGSVPVGPVYNTNYSGGAFRFYKDTTPDRNYGTNPPNATAPSSFEDGELILSGTLSLFKTQSFTTNNGGSYNANVLYTGGTQLGLINLCPDPVNGNHGRIIGVWQRGLSGTPAGYIRACDGKFDLNECAVPTESSTWGRIKSQIDR